MPTPYLVGTQPGFVGQASFLDGGTSGGPNFQIPPVEYNGKLYVAFTNLELDPTNPPYGVLAAFLGVSGSSDRQNFTVLDPSNAPQVDITGGQLSSNYAIADVANARIVFFSTSGLKLFCRQFNLSTETWGAAIAINGPSLGGDTLNTNPQIVATMLSATKFLVLYTSAPNGIAYVMLNAGVWGTPSTLVASAAHPPATLLGACIDSGGFSHIFYSKFTYSGAILQTATITYNRIDSTGVALGETTITSEANVTQIEFRGSVPKYLSAADRVVFPSFTRFPGSCSPVLPNEWFLVWVDTPRGMPSLSVEGIADSTDSLFSGPGYFFTNLDQSTYYVVAEFIADEGIAGPLDLGWEQVLLFQRSSSASSWSSPVVFYNAQTDSPSGPAYHNNPDSPIPPAELNSLAFVVLSDGQIAGTFGMLSDVCGVMFFIGPLLCPPETGTPGSLPTYTAPNPPGSCIPWTSSTPRASFVFYDMPLEKQGS